MGMSNGEVGKWIEQHEYGDVIILCLFAIAILSLLTVLGWAYFVIDVEYGMDNIRNMVMEAWEAVIK